MALYDNYRLANSQLTRQYQGNALGELMKVGDVMQNRYDQSVMGMEGIGSMLRNAQALDKDKPLLQQRMAEYNKQLQAFSQRPDLENINVDVAKSARRFTEEYKHFADNVQRAQAYQEDIEKQVTEGKISKERGDTLLQVSKGLYSGLQYDPTTGRYQGQFSGLQAAPEVDINEWVRKVASDIAEQKGGVLTESTDGSGDFFVKRGSTYERITADMVNKAVGAALANDRKLAADLDQRAQLAGYSAALNPRDLPTDLREKVLTEARQSGRDPREIAVELVARENKKQSINNIYNLAYKYTKDNRTSSYELTETSQGSEKAKDKILPLTATINQPLKVLSSGDPRDLDKDIEGKEEGRVKALQDMAQWIKDEGVVRGANGRFVDKNGNDVTFTHQQYKDIVQQAHNAKESMENLKKKAKEQAKFYISPELEKRAKDAYDREMRTPVSNQDGFLTPESEEASRIRNAQKAYDGVIENSPGYKRYKQVLTELSKGQSMQIGITTFGSKAANEQAAAAFKNLALNLDTNGLEFGALGLQWGTGDKAGEALEAADYEKIRDRAEFVGTGIDADGKYKFYYKVGNVEGTAKKGGPEGSVIVKMPAMAGTAEALIQNKQITQAEQILTQSVAEAMNKPDGNATLNFNGWTVEVQRVDAANARTDGSDIILKYKPEGSNRYTEVPVKSRAQAVNSLIQTIKNHQ